MIFYIKIAGIFLIIFSSIIIGFLLSEKLNNRRKFLSDFYEFLLNLQTNIRFFSEDIFTLIEKSAVHSIISIFKNLHKNSITYFWTQAMKNISSNTGLTKEDYDILNNFSTSLGTTDLNGQFQHIELYKNLISCQIEKAENEFKNKSKLYKILSFFAGAMLVVMII